MTEQAPLQKSLTYNQPAAAAGASDTSVLGEAPYTATVTSVTYAPDAAITGAATNNRVHRVINRGQDGTGATLVATLAYDSGVNAAAGDERTITLSATPANLVLASGDILAFESNAVGTGIADPGGRVEVRLSRS